MCGCLNFFGQVSTWRTDYWEGCGIVTDNLWQETQPDTGGWSLSTFPRITSTFLLSLADCDFGYSFGSQLKILLSLMYLGKAVWDGCDEVGGFLPAWWCMHVVTVRRLWGTWRAWRQSMQTHAQVHLSQFVVEVAVEWTPEYSASGFESQCLSIPRAHAHRGSAGDIALAVLWRMEMHESPLGALCHVLVPGEWCAPVQLRADCDIPTQHAGRALSKTRHVGCLGEAQHRDTPLAVQLVSLARHFVKGPNAVECTLRLVALSVRVLSSRVCSLEERQGVRTRENACVVIDRARA